mmetsp:Transcript_23519/g.51586  ORF Transcript_23519/g.51586 Transcript_23519/m.51586 type:complete len:252 (+) Transcript_23519:418-1173(+)
MVKVRPHDCAEKGSHDARDRQREHVSDAECNGDGLGKLELEGRDNSDPNVAQGNHCRLELHRVFHGHHGYLGLVVDELVRAHLLGIGNAILVGVHFVIFFVRDSNAGCFVPADLEILEHVGASQIQGCFGGRDSSKVGAAKCAEAESEDYLDDVGRQNLVDFVQLLCDPHVGHDDDDQRLHTPLQEACDALLDGGVLGHLLQVLDEVRRPREVSLCAAGLRVLRLLQRRLGVGLYLIGFLAAHESLALLHE